jgi:hypothetical protein
MVTAAARASGSPVTAGRARGDRGEMPPKLGARQESSLERISGGQVDFDAKGELCILEGRLYLASLRSSPAPDPNKFYITLTQKMRYVPYCADFGPFNLGEICKLEGSATLLRRKLPA